MKREEEQIRAYFASVKPTEEFVEKLKKLEKKKQPCYGLRVTFAAAACLALAFIGWRVLDLRNGNPNFAEPTEAIRVTEATDPQTTETDPIPVSSEELPVQTDPTEAPTELTEAPTEPPEDTNPSEETETFPAQVPTAKPQVPIPEETEAEAVMGSGIAAEPKEPPEPVTEPTEPNVTEPDPPPEDPTEPAEGPMEVSENPTEAFTIWDSPPEKDCFTARYQRAGSKEFIFVDNLRTMERLKIDVTGQLADGSFRTVVTLSGVELIVTVEFAESEDFYSNYDVVVKPVDD